MGGKVGARRQRGSRAAASFDVHLHHDHKVPSDPDVAKVVNRVPRRDGDLGSSGRGRGRGRADAIGLLFRLGDPQQVELAVEVVLELLAALGRVDRPEEILVRVELVVRRQRRRQFRSVLRSRDRCCACALRLRLRRRPGLSGRSGGVRIQRTSFRSVRLLGGTCARTSRTCRSVVRHFHIIIVPIPSPPTTLRSPQCVALDLAFLLFRDRTQCAGSDTLRRRPRP